MALLQGAGPGLPNMDFLLEDFGHRLVPRKCISVGRSFSLWAPGFHTLVVDNYCDYHYSLTD